MAWEVIKELLVILGGTVAAVAAVAWLARSIITHFLSKDVERYKAELKGQQDLAVEKLRAELAKQVLEHEVQYRRVDEKVAGVVAEVYQRLFRFYKNVASFVKIIEWSGEPSKDEKLKAVVQANGEFWDYFLCNRVYVPPKLYARVKAVADKLASIAGDMAHGQRREKQGIVSKGEDYWMKAFKEMEDDATPLFSALVREVQERLGVRDLDENATKNCEGQV